MSPTVPRLAIGLPVFNGERYLAETLECLLGQTFGDFELLVSDNASTDRTAEIVEAYCAKDARIRYERNEVNIGASPNFTHVARRATRAPLFKWIAHDDLYAPTYLERCIKVLDARPEVVMAHSDCIFIDAAGKAFPSAAVAGRFLHPVTGQMMPVDPVDLGEGGSALSRYTDVLLRSRIGTHMFGVIRRAALDQTHLIPDCPSSDRPLLAELALIGPFCQVREPLFFKRFHEGMSWSQSDEHLRIYASGVQARYNNQLRKLQAYLVTPTGKPIGAHTKLACFAMLMAYSGYIAGRDAMVLCHRRLRLRSGDARARGVGAQPRKD